MVAKGIRREIRIPYSHETISPRSRAQTHPHVATPFHSAMERYLLCGEILSLPQTSAVYKGRRRGTVEFFAIHKYDKSAKDRVANGVR